MFHEYPAWRYSTDGRTVVVLDKEQDEELGSDWSDKIPEDFVAPTVPTYSTIEHVLTPVDVDKIERELSDAPVRQKPGPKPKAK